MITRNFVRSIFAFVILGVFFSSVSSAVQSQAANFVCVKNNTKYRVAFIGDDVYEDFAAINKMTYKLNRLVGKEFDVYIYPNNLFDAKFLAHVKPAVGDTIYIEYDVHLEFGGFIGFYKDSVVHVEQDGTCSRSTSSLVSTVENFLNTDSDS